ncbi:uncharacterized protein LOC115442779 [Manduca sexta]|uniref:uncharacterized protein LOC115442779 n=1 Tax=Manduca sexta TaxID=7130 RepID=UPI0018907C56|nr:uncharacterized protein LOC115442779 [Manduca sexta]
MRPNNLEANQSDPENGVNAMKNTAPSAPSAPTPSGSGNYKLKLFQLTMNLVAHILIGAVVGISMIFSFQYGLPMNATLQHIVLCVIGYQLLTSQAILSLSPNNGWSGHLKLIHKRRAHWILQTVGSGLAIAGNFIKIIDKSVHWNTLHGIFGLVALIFTIVSLVNGVTSLWAFELRKYLPSNLSKISHILFGTIAFASSSLSLCYGFDKGMFRNWLSDALAHTLIAFTAIFTFIIIIDPCISFFSKSLRAIRR